MSGVNTKRGRVTLIIPTHRAGETIRRTISSVLRGTVVPEIIVVDCGSGDGTPAAVREKFPRVRVVELGLNPGRAHAVNTGFLLAQTPYVMTLGQNTIVGNHCVQTLCEALDEDASLFSAQAKILKAERPQTLLSAGWNMDAAGVPYRRGQGLRAIDYGRRAPILAADLSATVYRSRVLEETGLLDERLYNCYEDVDLGYRARLAGYRNAYIPRAVVRMYSGTGSAVFQEKVALGNLMYLRYKNMSSLQQILSRPLIDYYRQLYRREARRMGMISSYNAAVIRGRMLCFNAEMELAERENCGMSVTKLHLPEEFAMAVSDKRLQNVYPLWLGERTRDGAEQIPAFARLQMRLLAGTAEEAAESLMARGGTFLASQEMLLTFFQSFYHAKRRHCK